MRTFRHKHICGRKLKAISDKSGHLFCIWCGEQVTAKGQPLPTSQTFDKYRCQNCGYRLFKTKNGKYFCVYCGG